MAHTSRALRRIGLETGAAILALSQVNEDGQVRESRAIKQDAEIFLQIEDGHLWVMKNRNGERNSDLPICHKLGALRFHEMEGLLAPELSKPEILGRITNIYGKFPVFARKLHYCVGAQKHKIMLRSFVYVVYCGKDMNDSLSTTPPISGGDRELLERLFDVINGEERPMLVGREGANIQFPEPVFHLLVEIVRKMHRGQSVVLLPANEELTTQAAANQLGMSRTHFVKLVDEGKIPSHMVGSHRRVYLHDLLEFAKARDLERSQKLTNLTKRIEDEGLYDSDYVGDSGME